MERVPLVRRTFRDANVQHAYDPRVLIKKFIAPRDCIRRELAARWKPTKPHG